MKKDDSFEASFKFIHETDNAILVYDYASEENIWIPLSQVHEIHREDKETVTIVMTAWIARQKGLL